MPTTARWARAPHDTVLPIVVSRRPIFDAHERVVAYELLTPVTEDPREAAAGVLARALLDIGLPRLAGARPVHVAVTMAFLRDVRPLPFAPQQVVLEVDPARPVDRGLLADLRAEGFRVALDGFRHFHGGLLDIADAVKIDARSHEHDLRAAVDAAHGYRLIATGVHSRRAAADCRALGFDGFQGRFCAEPELVTGAQAPTHRLATLARLAADAAVEFEELERVIGEDPGLALKLGTLANSACFAGRHRVGSLRQALITLGTVRVRCWATMLALSGAADRPSHLLELGLMRARLCEQLAHRTPEAEPARAFTAGLFSVADALLGMRMPDVLRELPFDERTERTLAAHAGPEGELLADVLAYEQGDFEGCERLRELALVCPEALDWSANAVAQLAV